jgi:hypothetical protein
MSAMVQTHLKLKGANLDCLSCPCLPATFSDLLTNNPPTFSRQLVLKLGVRVRSEEMVAPAKLNARYLSPTSKPVD